MSDQVALFGILNEVLISSGFKTEFNEKVLQLSVCLKHDVAHEQIWLPIKINSNLGYERQVIAVQCIGGKWHQFYVDDRGIDDPNVNPTKIVRKVVRYVKIMNLCVLPLSIMAHIRHAVAWFFETVNPF